jgi:lipopolysaccharide transport system ATP-binding protein
VLAVGDAIFQRRCLERMTELARGGRALLFVSHNLELIPKFCHRAILMDQGSTKLSGAVHHVTNVYLKELQEKAGGSRLTDKARLGHGKARFSALRFLDAGDQEIRVLQSGEDLRCVLEIESSCSMTDVSLAIVVKTLEGTRLLSSWTEEVGFVANLEPGIQQFECRFERVRIRPGRQVAIEIWMHDGSIVDHIEDACVLDVVEVNPTGFSSRVDQGSVLFEYSWREYGARGRNGSCPVR